MNLSKNMEALKIKKGITFSELECLTGISKSTLNRYLKNNIQSIKVIEEIEAIAEALDTNPIILLGWNKYLPDLHKYSNNKDFRELQEAIEEIDQLTEVYAHLYYAFGFDIKAMTGEEIISRASALRKTMDEIAKNEVKK